MPRRSSYLKLKEKYGYKRKVKSEVAKIKHMRWQMEDSGVQGLPERAEDLLTIEEKWAIRLWENTREEAKGRAVRMTVTYSSFMDQLDSQNYVDLVSGEPLIISKDPMRPKANHPYIVWLSDSFTVGNFFFITRSLAAKLQWFKKPSSRVFVLDAFKATELYEKQKRIAETFRKITTSNLEEPPDTDLNSRPAEELNAEPKVEVKVKKDIFETMTYHDTEGNEITKEEYKKMIEEQSRESVAWYRQPK